jgi:putative DNA-invertase from lambdoid prophage Rac
MGGHSGTAKAARAAIYLRVSTEDQTHASQEREVTAYCQRRGWRKPIVCSDKTSAAKTSRPGLDKLLQAVRSGLVDVVVCYKLDRLGRSLTHLAIILDELARHQVALICTSQGIDTSTDNPVGKLQLGVLMAVAEFERSMIRERTCAGLRAAKARGVKLGRPRGSDEKVAAIYSAADRLGPKVRAIARELGLAPSVVSRALRDR